MLFGWLLAPLGFPVVGLTVLTFPTPSPLLDRWPRLPLACSRLCLAAAGRQRDWRPLYLLGADGAAPAAGLVRRAAAAVVGDVRRRGAGQRGDRHRGPGALSPQSRRERAAADPDGRVYTGVPGALAWAIAEGVPLVAIAAARPPRCELPWAADAGR